jgi:methyl-accepting chemotaxis protein
MAMFTAGMAAVQAAISAVSGAINSVMASFDEMDRVADTSARLGVASDQLVALGYAAQQSGSSADTLNSALEKMQNNIGEASAGSESAKAAFERLGLSVETLKGMSADQAFAAISDKMAGVGSATDRTKIALDIFGKSGGELIQLLSGGSDGLNAMGAEAESLGLMLGNAREGVGGVNDSIDKMKAAWGGFVQQVGILVAPAIEKIATALATVVGWMNQLFGAANRTDGTFKTFGTEASKAATVVTKAVKASESAAKESAKAIKETFASVPKPSDWKTEGIGAITRGSAAGFSAVQEAQRQRQDEERRHRESTSWYARIERAVVDSRITVSPVSI